MDLTWITIIANPCPNMIYFDDLDLSEALKRFLLTLQNNSISMILRSSSRYFSSFVQECSIFLSVFNKNAILCLNLTNMQTLGFATNPFKYQDFVLLILVPVLASRPHCYHLILPSPLPPPPPQKKKIIIIKNKTLIISASIAFKVVN